MMSGQRRRGLTLVELMVALAITAVIASAIATMMQAFTVGVQSRRDSRETIIASAAAAQRLAAYISPSRAVLDAHSGEAELTLWFNDDRAGSKVHATEIRWIVLRADGVVELCFVDFPPDWTQAEQDLQDREYNAGQDWDRVYTHYKSSGWITSFPLVEGISKMSILLNDIQPTQAQHMELVLSFATNENAIDICMGGTILLHEPPL